MDKIRGRLSETESLIATTEDLTACHDDALLTLQRTNQSLVAKSDNEENWLRRNNVRVLGLVEGDHLADFAEAFFMSLLDLTEVPPTYAVERAHRVPTGRSTPGAPPRPFLVRFLNYRDRDRIICEASKHPTLPFEHTLVHLYPDFSADLQRRRKTFTDVRRRLWERDIKYSMLYPSRLQVQHGGTVKFSNPLMRLTPGYYLCSNLSAYAPLYNPDSCFCSKVRVFMFHGCLVIFSIIWMQLSRRGVSQGVSSSQLPNILPHPCDHLAGLPG